MRHFFVIATCPSTRELFSIFFPSAQRYFPLSAPWSSRPLRPHPSTTPLSFHVSVLVPPSVFRDAPPLVYFILIFFVATVRPRCTTHTVAIPFALLSGPCAHPQISGFSFSFYAIVSTLSCRTQSVPLRSVLWLLPLSVGPGHSTFVFLSLDTSSHESFHALLSLYSE